MSTQVNQFLMWGVKMPYKWCGQWHSENGGKDFYETFESFMDDSAFKPDIKHKEGIFCLFDGRDGRYIISGRVLAKAHEGTLLGEDEPLEVGQPLSLLEQELIQGSVKRNFGLDGPFRFYFVTHLR